MNIGVATTLVWVFWFFHWVSKADFYPIAGKGWRTKVFWGASILLFNPLMLLLYIVFGIRRRSTNNTSKRLIRDRILVFGCFAVSLLFALPIGTRQNEPLILTKETNHKTHGFSAKVATVKSSPASVFMTCDSGFESITYLDLQHIAILNKSDHPLAIKTAHKLQQYLLSTPSVKEVAYYPKGTYPEEGSRLPSLYIELDADLEGIRRPMVLKARGELYFRIYAQASTSPGQPLPISSQSCNFSLPHQSTTIGYESYAAKYDSAANDIIITVFSLMKRKSWYSSTPTPPMPEYVLGTYSTTPPMPFDANPSLGKYSGYDLLTHNHTTWWFEESRPDQEALAAYREALLEDGWEDRSNNGAILRMRRGDETLYVSRWENTPRKGAIPMIARYKKPFSSMEIDATLLQLLGDETVPVDTLLFFGRQFRESTSERVIAEFRERMDSSEPGSIQGHLELSRFWGEQGELEKARKALSHAITAFYLSYDGSEKNTFEQQAEKLGDPTLMDSLPKDQDLRNLGLIPLEEITTNITFSVTPEKPFGFYAFGSAYDADTHEEKVRTYTFRVVHDPFKTTSFYNWKSQPNRHWSLVRYGSNPADNTFSWALMDGNVNDGLWSIGMNLELRNSADTRIRIDVHQIDDETFQCSLRPLVEPVSHITIL